MILNEKSNKPHLQHIKGDRFSCRYIRTCILWQIHRLDSAINTTMWKFKELSTDLKEPVIDLKKTGKSLGAFSKQLQVPRSTVQSTVGNYKVHCPAVSLPPSGKKSPAAEKESLLKNHKKTSLQWIRSCSSVFFINMSWEAAMQERSSCSRHCILKLNSSLLLIPWTKRKSFLKGCLATMSSNMFGGKKVRPSAPRSVKHGRGSFVMGLFCCQCSKQSKWNNVEGGLWRKNIQENLKLSARRWVH